jgi:diadenosine tetraphosphatase ApaH/serine/threonine PP2A family protein phosphatase
MPDQITLAPGCKYFLNPGSIGQPRDGDWRAAYVIYDTEHNMVEQRRVRYDLITTQRKVREAGLPGRLADRLAAGR